jgi:hypothetical protein
MTQNKRMERIVNTLIGRRESWNVLNENESEKSLSFSFKKGSCQIALPASDATIIKPTTPLVVTTVKNYTYDTNQEINSSAKNEHFHLKSIESVEGNISWEIICSIYEIAILPVKLISLVIIPDCRNEKRRKYFMVTFLVCSFLNSIFCYVMVWMITVIGN